jgi:hypothetical protein
MSALCPASPSAEVPRTNQTAVTVSSDRMASVMQQQGTSELQPASDKVSHICTLSVTFLPLRPISQLPEPASTRLKAGACPASNSHLRGPKGSSTGEPQPCQTLLKPSVPAQRIRYAPSLLLSLGTSRLCWTKQLLILGDSDSDSDSLADATVTGCHRTLKCRRPDVLAEVERWLQWCG